MSLVAAWVRTLRNPAFRLAASDMAGTSLGIAAWGLVTGVAMVKSGMSVGIAIFMSLLVELVDANTRCRTASCLANSITRQEPAILLSMYA